MNVAFIKVKRLSKTYMKPYSKTFYGAIILSIVASIINVSYPFIIGLAITELTKNIKDIMNKTSGASINFHFILIISITIVVLMIIGFISEYFSNFFISGAVQNTIRDLRKGINNKMNKLPVSYFDNHLQGQVLSVLTNDIDSISNALQQTILKVVNSFFTIVTTYIMMIIISVPLGLSSLVLIPAVYILSKSLTSKSQKRFLEMQNSLADLNGYIQEAYSGFDVLRLYNQENNAIEKFKVINGKLNSNAFKATFTSSLLSPLLELLVDILYIIMIFFAGMAVMFSGMALGSMQAFVQYIWQIYTPLGQVSQMSTSIQSAMASVERVIDFMNEKEEPEEVSKITKADFNKIRGNIKFEHVSFSYSKETPLIQDLNFEVKEGQKIAIVGPTGAGKTTLINLLMRFYTIDSGKILIDGLNIYDMNRSEVRSLFGIVLQDAWLYNATIADNIRFGKLDATKVEIVSAAKVANVDHFIRTRPGSYNMMINREADNVSLGQKQLLTIARVILLNPKFLILDEATSSVDTRLEVHIQKAMKEVIKGRTSFIIAHRLSTIRDSDLILVMDKGNIVEQGNHDELLAKNGLYEKLYNSQFSED